MSILSRHTLLCALFYINVHTIVKYEYFLIRREGQGHSYWENFIFKFLLKFDFSVYGEAAYGTSYAVSPNSHPCQRRQLGAQPKQRQGRHPPTHCYFAYIKVLLVSREITFLSLCIFICHKLYIAQAFLSHHGCKRRSKKNKKR